MSVFSSELNKRFDSFDDMIIALKSEKERIITQKKSIIKRADCYTGIQTDGVDSNVLNTLKDINLKAFAGITKSVNYLKETNIPNLIVTATSNTTNWFDSHKDVHIDGIWKKTLKDHPNGFPHIQEHEYDFDKVISMKAETTVKNTTFKKLGFEYDGTTQALTFKSIVDPNRNLFMYNQYANGWVEYHSVGMQYVNMVLCANSKLSDMDEEKANWDKYFTMIANKDAVNEHGYFWAILEAKLKEHSAVVFPSNVITPTNNIEIEAEKSLPELEQEAEIITTKENKNYLINLI